MSKCINCQEISEYQKFLVCGGDERHTLCQICIQNLAKPALKLNSEIFVECQLCRKNTWLPNGQVTKLRTKFFVKLLCENCSEEKYPKDLWWCATCEKTICSFCAMKLHRQHDCSRWENYDVPKEIISWLKRRIEINDIRTRKVKVFCQQLESKLLEYCETNEDYSKLISRLESCFGSLPVTKPKKENLANIEKKFKVAGELMKSMKFNSDDFGIKQINDRNNEASIIFPSVNKVLYLFKKRKSCSTSCTTDVSMSPIFFPLKAQPVINSLTFESFKWFDNVYWPPSTLNPLKVAFAIKPENIVCCTDSLKVYYFSIQKEFILTNSFSLWSSDEVNINKCSSQIVYHETRDSFFVTKQLDADNRIGSLLEFSSNGLELLHTTKLPSTTLETNSLYMLGLLNNGTVVLIVSDGIKLIIYFKYVSILKTNHYDRIFVNAEDTYIAPNIPLEEITRLNVHLVEKNKEMLFLSGTKSIYCFLTSKNRIQFFKYFPNALQSSGFSFYCFTNNANIFIADFAQSMLRKINFETDEETISNLEGITYNSKLAVVYADKNIIYLMTPMFNWLNSNDKHVIVRYKIG